MKLKKTMTQGVCAAMRCKSPAGDLLCEKHEQEWRDAGSPALTKENEPGTSLAIPTHIQAELTTERAKYQDAIQMVRTMPLTNQTQIDKAGQFVGMAQTKIKELEEQRKSVVQPLNNVVKEINSWFRPVVESLETVRDILKERIAESIAAGQKAQDEALRKIEEGGGKADASTLLVAHNTPVAPSNITVRKVLVGRVVDFSKLPDRFKEVNVSALKAAVTSGEKDIPGVVIEEQDQVIGRSI